jgi:hypothetical protein
MSRVLVPFLSVLLLSGVCDAQDISPALQNELLQATGRPIANEEDSRRLVETIVKLSWELLQPGFSASQREALKSTSFRFERDPLSTAARVESGHIVVSLDTIFDLMIPGAILGHDIAVETRGFSAAPTVAYQPINSSAIIPLVESLYTWAQFGTAAIQCSNNNSTTRVCGLQQASAMLVGMLGFVLAHEASHILLKHRDTTIEQELAADREATAILHRLLKTMKASRDDEIDLPLIVESSPPLMMMYLRSRSRAQELASDDPAGSPYTRRYEQLISLVPEDDRYDVESLLEPESIDGGFGELTIAADLAVDALYIDGVRYASAEMRGGTHRLRAGGHVVFATRGESIAYERVYIGAERRRTLSIDVRHPVTSRREIVATLARDRKWLDVLMNTGGVSGAHTADTALDHYRALSRLGLGRFIPSAPDDLATDAEIRTVEGWRQASLPLGAWR